MHMYATMERGIALSVFFFCDVDLTNKVMKILYEEI